MKRMLLPACLFTFCTLLVCGEGRCQPASGKTLVDPAIAALADGAERPDKSAQTIVAYLPILYPSSHAANLLELKNGDILCVWFSGTWEGNSGVGIVMSRLPHREHHWTQTKLIDTEEGVSYQNPAVFQEPDGTLDLYHSTQKAGAGEADAHVLHAVSKDNGETWTKPELLFGKPGAFDRHPLLILPNGSWLLPMDYVTSKGIGEGSETNYSVTELTSDQGKTWRECVMAGTLGKVQPTVVQTAPGHLLAFLRSRAADWIYSSTSEDGCTWTASAPTGLPNNNASVQLFRLRNGHLVLAFNNTQTNRDGGKPVEGLRKPLSVALSEDDGKTWSYVRDVENGRPGYGLSEMKIKQPGREEYSYPTIMQASSGKIFIAYTFRRQTIKVVSFTEDWIRRGGTVGVYHGTQAPGARASVQTLARGLSR